MNEGQLPQPAEMADLLELWKRDTMGQINCCMPGTIVSFDPTKRTAVVQPTYNRVYNDGTVRPYPLLPDCPVFTMQGGGGHLIIDPSPGDECLVIFADANIDAWFAGGGQQTPPYDRKHDISDGFCLIGVNSQANPITTPIVPGEMGLGCTQEFGVPPAAKIAIQKATGLITIQNSTTSLAAVLQAFFTAAAGDPGLSGPTKSAAAAAALALLTLLY